MQKHTMGPGVGGFPAEPRSGADVKRQEASSRHGHYRPRPAREYSPDQSSDVRAQSRATTSGDDTQYLPPGEQRQE
jgi:hypothetical protein